MFCSLDVLHSNKLIGFSKERLGRVLHSWVLKTFAQETKLLGTERDADFYQKLSLKFLTHPQSETYVLYESRSMRELIHMTTCAAF